MGAKLLLLWVLQAEQQRNHSKAGRRLWEDSLCRRPLLKVAAVEHQVIEDVTTLKEGAESPQELLLL